MVGTEEGHALHYIYFSLLTSLSLYTCNVCTVIEASI